MRKIRVFRIQGVLYGRPFRSTNKYMNRPFPSCCEPHYESEAMCKTFHMKISFV